MKSSLTVHYRRNWSRVRELESQRVRHYLKWLVFSLESSQEGDLSAVDRLSSLEISELLACRVFEYLQTLLKIPSSVTRRNIRRCYKIPISAEFASELLAFLKDPTLISHEVLQHDRDDWGFNLCLYKWTASLHWQEYEYF